VEIPSSKKPLDLERSHPKTTSSSSSGSNKPLNGTKNQSGHASSSFNSGGDCFIPVWPQAMPPPFSQYPYNVPFVTPSYLLQPKGGEVNTFDPVVAGHDFFSTHNNNHNNNVKALTSTNAAKKPTRQQRKNPVARTNPHLMFGQPSPFFSTYQPQLN